MTRTFAHRRNAILVSPIKRPRQRGYVLVMFALALVPILLMVGFSVDVGSWYNRAAQLRKAADAAALAGVVWLPDEGQATAYALAAAARNGVEPGNGVSITVQRSSANERRLKVSITDTRVGSFFFKNLGGNDISLTRHSFAEYRLPVPLGSPRNYFGTGELLPAGPRREYLNQAINTYCYSKVQGDRHQSRYFSANTGHVCTPTLNTEYRPDGYELYIDAPEGRPAGIDVLLYDPQYRPGTFPDTGNGSENFSYELWRENSPFTPTDDVRVCGPTTYTASSGYNYTFLSVNKWNRLCTIQPGWASGRYILKARNGSVPGSALGSNQWGVVARYTNGAAGPQGFSNGLCDAREWALCPSVYGKDAISVYAASDGSTAQFFLAEIEPEHAGKKLKLELWDPGEGGSVLRILQPTGQNTWSPKQMSWSAYYNENTTPAGGGRSGTNQTSIDITGSRYNGHRLVIEVDLTGYTPPANNHWWKLEYEFNDPGRPDVTDRTTWTADIIGDPVHLVEEY